VGPNQDATTKRTNAVAAMMRNVSALHTPNSISFISGDFNSTWDASDQLFHLRHQHVEDPTLSSITNLFLYHPTRTPTELLKPTLRQIRQSVLHESNIDYALTNSVCPILTTRLDDLYGSDHFPLLSVLTLLTRQPPDRISAQKAGTLQARLLHHMQQQLLSDNPPPSLHHTVTINSHTYPYTHITPRPTIYPRHSIGQFSLFPFVNSQTNSKFNPSWTPWPTTASKTDTHLPLPPPPASLHLPFHKDPVPRPPVPKLPHFGSSRRRTITQKTSALTFATDLIDSFGSSDYICYTDGSMFAKSRNEGSGPAGSGSAVSFARSTPFVKMEQSLGNTTNNCAELWAVWLALKTILAHPDFSFPSQISTYHVPRHIRILTDSRYVYGALYARNKIKANTDLVSWILDVIDLIAQTYIIDFYWIAAHVSLPGNETADALAKHSAKLSRSSKHNQTLTRCPSAHCRDRIQTFKSQQSSQATPSSKTAKTTEVDIQFIKDALNAICTSNTLSLGVQLHECAQSLANHFSLYNEPSDNIIHRPTHIHHKPWLSSATARAKLKVKKAKTTFYKLYWNHCNTSQQNKDLLYSHWADIKRLQRDYNSLVQTSYFAYYKTLTSSYITKTVRNPKEKRRLLNQITGFKIRQNKEPGIILNTQTDTVVCAGDVFLDTVHDFSARMALDPFPHDKIHIHRPSHSFTATNYDPPPPKPLRILRTPAEIAAGGLREERKRLHAKTLSAALSKYLQLEEDSLAPHLAKLHDKDHPPPPAGIPYIPPINDAAIQAHLKHAQMRSTWHLSM